MTQQQVIKAEDAFVDEQGLIARVQQQDQQAFHQLFLLYQGRVYAICWRMLADKSAAEDVCQEVFVQVWQHIGKFRGDSQFTTWLQSVTTNCVLSHLRKQKNWLQRVLSIETHAIEPEFTEGSAPIEQQDKLDFYIRKLPERCRLVFVLFAIEGYRHEEIAKKLSIAVGTSKAQYHRAKAMLQEWLS